MKDSKENKTFNIKGIMIASLLFFAIGAVVVIVKDKQETAEITKELTEEKEAMHEEQLALFNEIEQNLAEISAHEGVVRMNLGNSETGSLSPEERINQEIAIISELIARNNQLISDLQSQLDENNEEVLAYQERNKYLSRKLDKFSAKIAELEDLNALLAQEGIELRDQNLLLSNSMTALNSQLDSQYVTLVVRQDEIKALNEQLNASYYLVGNYKELEKMDIVEKEGGIIGIGATKTLKDDFNKAPFTKIDKSNYTTIPVFSEKAELATNHPGDSYKWVEEGDEIKWLEIVNPEEFWGNSKYLVILTGKSFSLTKSA